MVTDPAFQIRLVMNIWDAMVMRRMRNETRLLLTGNRKHIWPWQQVIWYYLTYRPQNRAEKFFAFLVWIDGRPGGFGIVREVDGKWWPTYALSEWARGGGRGLKLMRRMIRYAVELGGGVAWGKLREDNERIKDLDRKLGWEFLITDGTDITAIIEWREEMGSW